MQLYVYTYTKIYVYMCDTYIDIDIILFSQQTRLFVDHFTGEEIIHFCQVDNNSMAFMLHNISHTQHPLFTPPFL